VVLDNKFRGQGTGNREKGLGDRVQGEDQGSEGKKKCLK
jgi:hypothetical protein